MIKFLERSHPKELIKGWKDRKIEFKAKHGKDDLALIKEEDAILTEQGERVRSKSEKILADKLFMMSIPYIYECPLHVIGYGYVIESLAEEYLR